MGGNEERASWKGRGWEGREGTKRDRDEGERIQTKELIQVMEDEMGEK